MRMKGGQDPVDTLVSAMPKTVLNFMLTRPWTSRLAVTRNSYASQANNQKKDYLLEMTLESP
jgi:hypothetical protein